MKTLLRTIVVTSLILIAVAVTIRLTAQPTGISEGERLERAIWSEMKAKNWSAVEGRIAPGFQSVHPDGPRDRAAELALIKGLNLGEYTFKDFKVTESAGNLIVGYWISVPEVIDGKRLSSKPAMRLSVWSKTQAGWQWVAHANLNPL